eukprot:gb/GEZN01014142.1/.p1 GENE.gb/GEZN01014142.1/~~gb/GEZN01014142.1/.p1  ORF type:complete len:237 (+),score=42.02 gb/GEZN01014142.1/:2-712(+)
MSEEGDSFVTGCLLVAILCILGFLLYTQLPGLFKKKGDVILLTGLVGSGKTALFSALQPSGTFRKTYMSMKVNEKKFVPPRLTHPEANKWTWVDFPGHGSLCSGLPVYLARARAVIYVLDASTKSELNNSALQLAELFTGVLGQRGIPILVACNKTDLGGQTLSEAELKAKLEHLIQRKASMQDSELSDLSGAVSHGQCELAPDFSFASAPCRVEFCRISAKNQEVAPVVAFLQSI